MTKMSTTIIYFGGAHCPICKAMKPLFDAEMRQHGLDSCAQYIDAEECPEIAQEYNVRSIPWIVVEKDGNVVFRGRADKGNISAIKDNL